MVHRGRESYVVPEARADPDRTPTSRRRRRRCSSPRGTYVAATRAAPGGAPRLHHRPAGGSAFSRARRRLLRFVPSRKGCRPGRRRARRRGAHPSANHERPQAKDGGARAKVWRVHGRHESNTGLREAALALRRGDEGALAIARARGGREDAGAAPRRLSRSSLSATPWTASARASRGASSGREVGDRSGRRRPNPRTIRVGAAAAATWLVRGHGRVRVAAERSGRKLSTAKQRSPRRRRDSPEKYPRCSRGGVESR